MEREQEQQLYRMQADLCQKLADPTRLEMLSLLGEGPKAVKDLVARLSLRQAKVSQHLALLRQRGIVRAERIGNDQYIEALAQRLMPHLMPAILYHLRAVDPARERNRALGMSLALALPHQAYRVVGQCQRRECDLRTGHSK